MLKDQNLEVSNYIILGHSAETCLNEFLNYLI